MKARVETEKLGREADRAVWALEVAEQLRDIVLTVLQNHEERGHIRDLRRTMEGALGELVASYERIETDAVGKFVEAIQSEQPPRVVR